MGFLRRIIKIWWFKFRRRLQGVSSCLCRNSLLQKIFVRFKPSLGFHDEPVGK